MSLGREHKANAFHFGLLAELEELIDVQHKWEMHSSKEGYSIFIYVGEEFIAGCAPCSEMHYAIGITRRDYKRWKRREEHRLSLIEEAETDEETPRTMNLEPNYHIFRDAEGKPDIQAGRDRMYEHFKQHEVGHLALELENVIQTVGEHFKAILNEFINPGVFTVVGVFESGQKFMSSYEVDTAAEAEEAALAEVGDELEVVGVIAGEHTAADAEETT